MITINGLDALYKRFDAIAAQGILEPPMQRSVYRLENYMKNYPPAPTNSRYIRTGSLGRRWTTKVERSTTALTGRIGNNINYGPWVQSERYQTRVHRHTGWRTDEASLRDNEAAIVSDFSQTVDTAIQR